MEKPRIIIADTDINYIIPLQLKFAQDFFDQIDLEIITDKEFFDELFKKPQKSEILIVSDVMYNSSLQKHNIANIFLMMEQYEGENTSDLNVIRLYNTSLQILDMMIKTKNLLFQQIFDGLYFYPIFERLSEIGKNYLLSYLFAQKKSKLL